PSAKGIGKTNAKKSKIAGAVPSRSMGGRPERHSAQVPADYGEPAATDVRQMSQAAQPPDEGEWRFERHKSQDTTTPSRLVRPTFLNHEQRQQRAELRRVYSNQKCSCAENGWRACGPGAPDFVEHSLFCQLYSALPIRLAAARDR
ncbi:MAG: hypothetical protein SGPRY_003024, partial [Prymnesium sp.]